MKTKKSSKTKTEELKIVEPSNEGPKNLSADWPLLLKNFEKMNVKESHFTPSTKGYSPLQRPIKEYLKSGVINLDKPSNPSSHEVVAWVKRAIGCEKTGHSGTLDPKVTGCLIVCLDRATRLVKSQQNAGKEYIAVLKMVEPADNLKTLQKAVNDLMGALYQMPPIICAVKRALRSRTIFEAKVIEYDKETGRALIWVKCTAGTYVRTLCTHIGMLLGKVSYMSELRRVRSGALTERDNLVTLHDVLDAMWLLKHHNDESYIRRVVMPLEILLIHHKRILVKDSTIAAITFGAKVMLPGVLRYDNDIDVGEEIVIISTKGEGIALAYAQMSTATMASCEHGMVAKLKRVLMDRDLYDRQWGHGIHAQAQKLLKVQASVKEAETKVEPEVKKKKDKDIKKEEPQEKIPKLEEKAASDSSSSSSSDDSD